MKDSPQNKRYPPKTAGAIMLTNVPTIGENKTVREFREFLLTIHYDFDTFNYIYLLDEEKTLKGVISIRQILHSANDTKLTDLSPKKLIVVHPYTTQERVVHLALKHNLRAIPVVDHEHKFLGEFPSKAILRALHHESTEDLFRLGGVTHTATYDDILKLPFTTILKHRTPWLILGLLGGLLSAGIVSQFEDVLSKQLILASFIPLIVYMADAIGTQIEAFIIRDLAVDPTLNFMKYLRRQFTIVLILAILISGLLYVISLLLYDQPEISMVISLALFLAIMTSLFSGLFVPFIFDRLKFDPANASGPVATIIQDVLSVSVYFWVANTIL